MAEHLWLNEARDTLDESGEAMLWTFGQETVADTTERLRNGALRVTGGLLDPVAGHIVGEPEWSHGDMAQASWTADVPADWYNGTVEPYLLRTGAYAKALLHVTDDAWTLTANTAATWGAGFFLRVITYAGDVGTGGLTVTFGGAWRLTLSEGGRAALDEIVDGTWQTRAAFDWLVAAEFAPASHWLWVYEVGPKLVIQNVAPSAAGDRLGCVWQDSGQWIDPATGLTHALRPGYWSITSSGYAAISMVPQTWKAQATTVASGLVQVGWGGSSKQLTTATYGYGGVSPAVIAYDEEDVVWPQDTDPAGLRQKVRWSTAFTSTASATYALVGVGLEWPVTYQSDGNTGVDLLAVTGVADQQITVTRDDLTRENLRCTLPATGAFAAYIKPNMTIRYLDGTTTLFRGLTDDPSWQVIYDSTEQFGIVNLQAQGLWRRFRQTKWPGGRPFDGRTIEACLADICAAAGIQSSGYDLAATGQTFPAAPTGQPPALCYRAGVTLDSILADLADKWYGEDWWHFFRLSDGKFVLEAKATGASAATFYDTAAAAVTAGVPGQVMLSGSYTETLDDSQMANVVRVAGLSPTGRPLHAMAIDWPSIQTKTASNYVGEPWLLDIVDPALQTQGAVNAVCRSVFDRRRLPKVLVQWRSIRLNLFPEQTVTLVGANLSSVSVRLTGMSAERSNAGDANDSAGRASYSGVVL